MNRSPRLAPRAGPTTLILYEYPFNESIRTMLRLEHLFDRLGQLVARDAPVDHHFALATIFEIMDVASRADLKSDLLKELERQKALFNGFRGNPSISESALDEVLGRVEAGEMALAIAYSTVLILVMLAVIAIFQLAVGQRRLGRRAAPALVAGQPA